MNKIIIYDIECFGGMFLFCALDIGTGEMISFELSSRKNELDSMCKYLENSRDSWFVGFNNIRYDSQVVEYIYRNNGNWYHLTNEEMCSRIKKFSNEVIESQDYEEWPTYREKDLCVQQIDLFKIHHFDNKARAASLKWIAFMMDAEDIEELPYPHYKEDFTAEELDAVISYCWKDIANTLKFYNYTIGEADNDIYKGQNKIQDRLDIIEELNFPAEVMNFSDVKIGDEINKRGYCELKNITAKELREIRKRRGPTRKLTFGNCIPDYIKFETPELISFLDKIRPVKVNMSEKKGQEFNINFRGNHYVIAKGGIHTKDKARIVNVGPNELMKDADVGSQHPTTIVKRRLFPDHLGEEWLVNYHGQIVRRQGYKKKGETDLRAKGLSNLFKLALNGGGFGKTIDRKNWQYGPEVGFKCTIGNQFEILMLAERMELAGIKVLSANTDGILCLFSKDLNDKYNEICTWWQETVGNTVDGKLEFTEFTRLIQENVNSYIAIKKDGKLKIKGRFAVDGELNKNNTKDIGRIERKALVEYFTKGTPVEETITKSRNIFDFCIGLKSSKEYHYETLHPGKDGDTEEYKRIIRFYISNKGEKLLKIKNEDSEATGAQLTKIVNGYLVTIMNSFVEKPWEDYDINYDYYIENCQDIIHSLERKVKVNKNQTSLF